MKYSFPKLPVAAIVIAIAAGACIRTNDYPAKVYGYKPIYSTNSHSKEISYSASRPVTHAGKIYLKDHFIYQVDQGTGIHIMDASDPSHVVSKGFLVVDGCEDLAISGHHLYVNSITDLVTIDISDITHPVEVKRLDSTFYNNHLSEVPPSSGYFECPDASKGTVTAWYQDTINNPKCFY
ncbi:LVIVD repeat-containing protein [Filimonas effusa]|nr:hypothetical protein [Filimonas effusa]